MLVTLILASCNLQFSASQSYPLAATAQNDTTNNSDPSSTTEDPPKVEAPAETFEFSSSLIIKAVNPGYTTQNVGELIELQKVVNASSFSLAGYSLQYTNASGTSTTLIDFSEGSLMAGEFLLLRLARSPGSERADATYMTTLAIGAGKVELLYNQETVDQACWGLSQQECLTAFNSKHPTTLVRDLSSGNFEHASTYDPHYSADQPSLILPTPPATPESPGGSDDISEQPSPACRGLEFSEILSYYANDKTEQFVEIYNPTDRAVQVDACTLVYKKKSYPLSGTIPPDGYYVFYPAKFDLSFTKNPNSSNTIELLDADRSLVDALVYLHGQKKSTAYAKFYDTVGDEIWNLTYAPTPGKANKFQEFRTCEAGKVINPATGNCVKVVAKATTSTDCPAGKYRNPLTGRCKKIASESEPKPCKAGYERNPETGRCRKVAATNNDGADYALVPQTASEKSTFVALGAVILLVSLGVIYIVLQFRHEIARAARKARQRLHHVRKNLFARGISFRRHKKP